MATLNYQNKKLFMKKNYLKIISSFLLAVLFIAGCQKETKESTGSNELVNSAAKARENSCRTTVDDWPTVGRMEFHYNDKGLADEWTIDYGFGSPLHTNEMTYDNNDRLIQSNEFYFGSTYIYHFYYTGKLLTRLTRVNVDDPADAIDAIMTYNSKGQIIRQDDDVFDSHVLMTYDNIGNCTRTDLYFGDELYFSDIYSFNQPVRNPRAAVPGVDIGFPFYGTGGFSNKRMFTSNRTEIYDNGNLFLYNDYDPAQTTINTGNHNYPSSATYYDRVTEEPLTITFDYENCNGNGSTAKSGNSQTNINHGAKTSIKTTRQLLRMGSVKSMKEQIQKMKQQLNQ
jgi:hypothetical protein